MASMARAVADAVSASTAEHKSPDPVWEALRRRIHSIVDECNAEAGEPIWGISEPAGRTGHLEVRSRFDLVSSVELFLDPAEATVRCRFGFPRKGAPWVFHILPGSRLRRLTETYGIEEAASAILDHLVCAPPAVRRRSAR